MRLKPKATRERRSAEIMLLIRICVSILIAQNDAATSLLDNTESANEVSDNFRQVSNGKTNSLTLVVNVLKGQGQVT